MHFTGEEKPTFFLKKEMEGPAHPSTWNNLDNGAYLET